MTGVVTLICSKILKLKSSAKCISKKIKSAEVTVLDVHGKVLFQATVGVASHQILELDTASEWAVGTYFVNIIFDDGSRTIRQITKL